MEFNYHHAFITSNRYLQNKVTNERDNLKNKPIIIYSTETKENNRNDEYSKNIN